MRKKYQFRLVRDYFPAAFLFCSPDRRFRIALSGSSVTLPLPVDQMSKCVFDDALIARLVAHGICVMQKKQMTVGQ
jgi:hypothetical protein